MTIEVKNSIKPVDYKKSMKILENRVNDVYLGKKNELLWILEHNSVYTAGASSKKSDLINKKIKVIQTKRGGKYTYHGPGQKVVYLVLNLNNREKNIRKLISGVENCIIEVLKEYGIESIADRKNIGIWVKEKEYKKVAAIGIRVKKWIAYHGFSININNNLNKYKEINPCGLKSSSITNLSKIKKTNFKNIDKVIIRKFLNIFL